MADDICYMNFEKCDVVITILYPFHSNLNSRHDNTKGNMKKILYFFNLNMNNYNRNWTEPAYMVRPCSEKSRRKITQNSIEVEAETKESTRKTEEKLDGRCKEGHGRKKRKWRPVGR